MYHAQQKLHCISSSYIYVFDFTSDRGQVRWACQAGREHTRRKQSIANIATTNEYARFATAGKSIATVVEASLTIRGLIVVRG